MTNEKLTKVTVIKDETIGNVEREYREVKRPAVVGERIKIVRASDTYGMYENADVFTAEERTYVTGGVRVKSVQTDGNISGFIEDEEYVVLEPSDIVRVDNEGGKPGTRYRLVERKAAKGDGILIIAGDIFAGERFQPGGVYLNLITIGDDVFAEHAEGHRRVGEKRYANVGKRSAHYRVLEPVTSVEPSVSDAELLVLQRQLDSAGKRIATLEKETAGLTDAVAKITLQLKVAREDIVLIEEGVAADVERLKGVKAAAETRPAVQRDEIVARAKADVAELSTTEIYDRAAGISYWPRGCEKRGYGAIHEVDFVVNREKRTVVALVHRIGEGVTQFRGIAKAAPGDCFNVHIGRAIALRRALRLDIPAEYVNAPQPTEPRVGDVVLYDGCRVNVRPATEYCAYRTRGTATVGSVVAQCGVIIDDSREDLAASDRPFLIGSNVRIIGNGSDGMRHHFDIGDVGEIVSGPDKGGEYNVKGVITRETRRSKYDYSQLVNSVDLEAA